jgi:hypothetical protein
LALAAALAWCGCLSPSRAEAQTDEYCQYGTRTIVLYLDRTTQYDDADRDDLVGGLEQTIRSIDVGDRVAVFTIADHPVNSELLFDRCLPGCPDTGIFGELVSSCRPIIARQRALGFRADILAALQGVVTQPREYPYSAILDTLAEGLAAVELPEGSRVLVFSDMLENSPDLPWPAIARAEVGDLLERTGPKPDLAGVDVVVFGFGRDHSPAREPLPEPLRSATEAVWREILLAWGAQTVAISKEMRAPD